MFRFLNFGKKYKSTLNHYDNIIISCNGFAEFLSDVKIRKLYEEIFKFTQEFKGNVDIILPFANKNKEQEALGKKLVFNSKLKRRENLSV